MSTLTPEPPASDLLFACGTLRREAPIKAPASIKQGWTFESYGSVRGLLYDLGAFPGAVPPSSDEAAGGSEPRVRGEVYRLPDPAHTLRSLDRYEGCSPDDPLPHAFGRDLVEVLLDDGRVVTAWIYWYRLEPSGVRLEHGDYAKVEL